MSSTLDSAGWPQDDDSARRSTDLPGDRPAPGFLAAPFSGRTWRESLQALLNLPVGLFGFSFTVIILSFGLGTAPTFVGLPVMAAALIACRGFGAFERGRAAGLLDLRVPGPEPRRQARPGLVGWVRAVLTDGAGWRAALYSVLLLPLGVVSFVATVGLWCVAIPSASYPLWQWIYPKYVHQPGVELYDYHGHTHYLTGVPEIAALCALGVVLLFVTPQVLRALANLHRAMVRGLLSR